MKRLICLVWFLLSIVFVPNIFAQSNSYVSIVNPIRGNDFWDLKDQKPETAVLGQAVILDKSNLPATWLIRFDALDINTIISELKNRPSDDKGLFLEITPAWAKEAGVTYHQSANWHAAGSAFLTGYERVEREKLIDTAFTKFKQIFGSYPVSVGAWWIDSYSLEYMQKKYGIISGLIVSDQYSTDNYQIWGQYFSTPYYPDKKNALHPAQSLINKIPVVLSQWAARDPLNGYGNGVFESTFSVQANDYIDYHNLNTTYFASLLDVYTKQEFNTFGSVVIGLENTYDWNRYGSEYKKQIDVISQKSTSGQLNIVTLKDFASWYQKVFPQLSPEHLIVADDPLGSFKKVVWFMNPYYRAGLFYNQDGSVFRDIRQYIDGEEEICYQKSCNEVNFATFATRVLDEVTYGNKWVIDEGKIRDFNVLRGSDGYLINYTNEVGNKRSIEFLPRDIRIDGRISTIDGAILNAIKKDSQVSQKSRVETGPFSWSIFSVFSKTGRFILFLILVFIIPGLVLLNKVFSNKSNDKNEFFLERLFFSLVLGLVAFTVLFYITSLLNIRFLIFIYIFLSLFLFIKFKLFSDLRFNYPHFDKLMGAACLMIVLGTVFQIVPTFRSGLNFPYGLGFWGPNTHDGMWHISLINELVKGLPVQNPIFSDTILKNYHFFYDLTVAATTYLTKIPNLDLVFRFYPIIFSLFLGIGTYFLAVKLFKNKIAAIFSLYFVYFSGSFGWIVDYIKNKRFGGESAFWANQSISLNLNPPLAVSLLIIVAFLLLLTNLQKINTKRGFFISVLLLSSLIGFKSYGAILTIGALGVIGLVNLFKKNAVYLYICILSVIFSLIVFISNFDINQRLIIFSPFWLIHSMIDSPDRVGWLRLSLARIAGIETNNWFKLISSEAIGLSLFIGGNLGLRVLSFGSLIKINTILKDNVLLFIFVFTSLSFLFPILFIQSGNPWNTIQFSYYGLYVTAVVSGSIVVWLIVKLPKLFSIAFLIGTAVMTPINSITTASYYTGSSPHAKISKAEIQALEFLSRQKDGIVLTYPFDDKMKQRLVEPWPLFAYDSTAYVAALSGKSVYVEDEPQNQILLTDYKKRLIASSNFFLRSNEKERIFLAENKIQYIYIPKIAKNGLDEKNLNIQNIFENEEVRIYKVN